MSVYDGGPSDSPNDGPSKVIVYASWSKSTLSFQSVTKEVAWCRREPISGLHWYLGVKGGGKKSYK